MSELETTAATTNAAEEKRNQINEIFDEIKQKYEKNEAIEVEIIAVIKGDKFKVSYKGMPLPLPLPFKFYSKERNISEEEYSKKIGEKIEVAITEFIEEEFGRFPKLSRVKLLENELWKDIEVGKEVTAQVKSVIPQGLVFDLNGLDAFAPISHLSKHRVENINDFAKVGDVFNATIITAEREERHKIILSLRNQKSAHWENAFNNLAVGDKVKGTIKNILGGGMFVEIAPGIDGFVRNGEISWTKREVNLTSIFKIGQEIETEIIEIDKNTEKIALSYRRTMPNNFAEISAKYETGAEYTGIVTAVMRAGVIVSLNDEIEGFMPAGRMLALLNGNKIELKEFDIVQVRVLEKDVEKSSIIFESTIKPEFSERDSKNEERGARFDRKSEDFQIPRNFQSNSRKKEGNTYTLADLLSEASKKIITK